MKYIIASTSVTDEIRFANGKTVQKTAGGAGTYALCGMKLWTDDVLLVTGVGRDYPELYGGWFKDNELSMDGLIYKDEKTPHNVMVYYEDGERSETPLYGADHYRKIEVTPEELVPYFKTARGIYIFKNDNLEFWDKIVDAKKNSDTKVMWEIANDATTPKNLEQVKRIASLLDVFSINLTESKMMFGVENTEAVVERFREWGLPLVFLRQGSKGAIMITPEDVCKVSTVKDVCVVDPTGGGNSSSSAVLYGYCNGYTAKECGLMGSISAARCLEQYGVPKVLDQACRKAAKKLLVNMGGNIHDEK